MTRRGFLGGALAGLGSLPLLGFAKRAEASPVEAKSSPVQEAVGHRLSPADRDKLVEALPGASIHESELGYAIGYKMDGQMFWSGYAWDVSVDRAIPNASFAFLQRAASQRTGDFPEFLWRDSAAPKGGVG